MINEVRKEIKKLIEKTTGMHTFFRRAPNQEPYPYATFTLTEWNTGDLDKHSYTLTVDAWDCNNPKRVISAIETLDRECRCFKLINDKLLLQIYNGSGKEFIDEEDKNIVHLKRTYDVIAYRKGDWI